MQTKKLYTVEDMVQFEGREERYELDEGVLVEVSTPQPPHGFVQVNIGAILRSFVKPRKLGFVHVESGTVLQRNPDTLRGPDVWFASAARIADPLQGKYLEGGPELVVEIQSPADSPAQMLRRVSQYLAAGALLVWLVDTKRLQVTTYHADGRVQILTHHDTLTADPVLPEFSVPIQEFFE